MEKQLAIFLILFGSFCFLPKIKADELATSIQNNDWPTIVLLLKAKQGQNFEQDLLLSKALYSLERRQEAVKVLLARLNDKGPDKNTEKTIEKWVELYSTQFLNEDASRLYYEAVGLLASEKWLEAKEKLEAVNGKEPGHKLVLQRLLQVDLILDQKEAFTEHLKLAQEANPFSKELKIFQARSLYLQKEEQSAYRIFQNFKGIISENEVLCVWYLDVLSALNKQVEMNTYLKKLDKEHPQWIWVQSWFVKKPFLDEKEKKAFTVQITKTLKDFSKYKTALEVQARKTDYQWVGFFTAEALKAEFSPVKKGIN